MPDFERPRPPREPRRRLRTGRTVGSWPVSSTTPPSETSSALESGASAAVSADFCAGSSRFSTRMSSMDVFPPCALTIPVSVAQRLPKVGIVPTGAVAFDLIDGQYSPGLLVVVRCAERRADNVCCGQHYVLERPWSRQDDIAAERYRHFEQVVHVNAGQTCGTRSSCATAFGACARSARARTSRNRPPCPILHTR